MLVTLMVAVSGGPQANAVVPTMASKHEGGTKFDDFPLWKDVPVKAFAVLGEGRVRDTRWAAYVFRGASKRQGNQRPCIDVAHISTNGAYGYSMECGPLAPIQGPDVPPIFALTGGSHDNGEDGPIVGESFIGMTFTRQVEQVRLEFGSGSALTRPTAYLSERQSRKAHVARFRYLALGLARDVCIGRVTGMDKQGRTILDAATGECTPSA